MCHAVLPKFCVFLLELLFLENAVNKSDIQYVHLALLATIDRLVYQGIFLLRFFVHFEIILCEFSIENVKTVPYQV